MAPGGMFLVPKGNNYGLENVCQREVRLFFSQARNIHPANLALRASVQPVALPLRQQLAGGGMGLGGMVPMGYGGTAAAGGMPPPQLPNGGRFAGEVSFSEAPVSRPPQRSRYIDGQGPAGTSRLASSSTVPDDPSFDHQQQQEDTTHEEDGEDQGDEEVEDVTQPDPVSEDESALYAKPKGPAPSRGRARGRPRGSRGRGGGGRGRGAKSR